MASSDTGSRIEELNLFYEEARRNHSRPLWLSEGNEPPLRRSRSSGVGATSVR